MLRRVPRPMTGSPRAPKTPAPASSSRRAVSYRPSSAKPTVAPKPAVKGRMVPVKKDAYLRARFEKALPDAALRRLWSAGPKAGRGAKDKSSGLVRIDRDNPRIAGRKTYRGSREFNPSTVLVQPSTGRNAARSGIDRGGSWSQQLSRMSRDPDPAVAARARMQQQRWRAGSERREAVRLGQAPSRVPGAARRRERTQNRFTL